MRNNFLAPELKRMVDHGTRREKPARTKNVATKPSHGGPVESAKKEKTAARTREINPLRKHQGGALSKPPTKNDRALGPVTEVAAAPQWILKGGLESAPP